MQKILVLLDEKTLFCENISKIIEKLTMEYFVKLCFEIYDENEDVLSLENKLNNKQYIYDIQKLIDDIDILFIPFVTFELFKNLQDVNYDNAFVEAVIYAVSQNKNVFFLEKQFKNNGYFGKIQSKRQHLLNEMGFTSCKIEDIKQICKISNVKKIYTQEDILDLISKGIKTLDIKKGDILTALAKDIANENNILIMGSE